MIDVIYTNADCLINKFDELKYTIAQMYFEGIIAITETNAKNCQKIMNNNICLFQLKDFILITGNFLIDKFRGICCYIHKKYNFNRVKINGNFKEFLAINVRFNCFSFSLFIIYRSPNSTSDNNKKFLELLSIFSKLKGKKMLLGDFNLPAIDWCNMSVNNRGSKTLEFKFLSYIQGNNYIQHINRPTRIRQGQNCNVLDLVVTEFGDVVNIEYLPPLGKSDHCVIKCSFILGKNVPIKEIVNSPNIRKFNFNKGNYIELNKCLEKEYNVLEECIINNDNLDDIMFKYIEIVNNAMVNCIPLYPSLHKNNTLYNRYIPKEILKLIKDKKNVGNSI